MFRCTTWPAVFLVYVAAPPVQAAPLPPDRQWDEVVDTRQEEQLLRAAIAAGQEQLALAYAYLEAPLSAETPHSDRAVRAARQCLACAQETLVASAGHARWLSRHRAAAPHAIGQYLGDRVAAPLEWLTRQDLPLIEEALRECDMGSGRTCSAVRPLARSALTRLKQQLIEMDGALTEIEDTERIGRILEMRRARGVPLDSFGNWNPR